MQATPTVWPLVNAYRSRGHYNARLDPLGLLERHVDWFIGTERTRIASR